MTRQNQKGNTLAVIIVVVVVVVLGALAFVFWNNSTQPQTNSNEQEREKVSGSNKVFTIDNVSFSTPKTWTQDSQPTDKTMSLLPGEKLRTIYGDGTEYFHVYVGVYANPNKLTPQDWLINDAGNGLGGQGVLANSDTESNTKINGYDAYYRNTVNEFYEEVNYVLSASDTLVYIYARTYEVSADLPGVGDFRKFEPAIADLAESVTIK
jgi:hypothetical protein